MTRRTHVRGPSVAALALVTALTPALASASPPTITARLHADDLEVGQPTVLDVHVSGAPDVAVHVPQVPTVDIAPLGSSRQVEMVNGTVRESVTRHFRVLPRRAGRFELGPITAGGASAPPLRLTVRPATVPPAPARASRSRAAPDRRRAMLRVRIPKRRLVVGESVPITIRAYVKAGTAGTITGVPQLGSDAFAIHGLVDEAKQGRTQIDGTSYATLTWRGRLTALLPGDARLSASLPATLRWREVVRSDPMRDRFPSMFDRFFEDDPFAAGSAFAGSLLASRSTRRLGPEKSADVVLEHAFGTVHVSDPPAEGRPDDFDGAVGRFEVRAEVDPPRVRAGEPVTVRLTVVGQGTFERVTHPLFGDDPRFRSYPATSRFTARGGDGRRGEKVFEQTRVPLEPGRLELGALSFSYFDPRVGRYVTRRSEPLAVEVEPSADGATPVRDLDDASFAPDPGFVANRLSPGRFVERLRPAAASPLGLLAALLVMGLAVAGGVALARRDPDLARARRDRRRSARGVARARRRMRRAARRGDAETFYETARAYVQQRFGAAWGLAPEALTLAELESRLDGVPEPVRDVLDRADAIRFGGVRGAAPDPRAVSERLERALDREVLER